jgi:hypothetical protein
VLLTLLTGIHTGAEDRPSALEPPDGRLLIAGNKALAGIERLCVVVAATETPEAKRLVDTAALRTTIVSRLRDAGIAHVECKTGLTPRLIVQIEATHVPDCGRHVYRVQASVNRVVTFSNHRDLHVLAAVWQPRPTIQVAVDERVVEAIGAAVIVQVDAFLGAYDAARRLQPRAESTPAVPPSARTGGQDGPEDAVRPSLVQFRFVASRNSSVFHRPDCRWAQNIAEKNLVGFETRDEALRAGKRGCKSCRP